MKPCMYDNQDPPVYERQEGIWSWWAQLKTPIPESHRKQCWSASTYVLPPSTTWFHSQPKGGTSIVEQSVVWVWWNARSSLHLRCEKKGVRAESDKSGRTGINIDIGLAEWNELKQGWALSTACSCSVFALDLNRFWSVVYKFAQF